MTLHGALEGSAEEPMSAEQIARSVVRVDATRVKYSIEEPWRSSTTAEDKRGTGWFLRTPRGIFVFTCYHCIKGALEGGGIFVRSGATGGTRIPARVALIAPDIDAALLEVDDDVGSDFEPLPVGDDKTLTMGDTLFVYGYPGGQSNVKTVRSRLNGRQGYALQIDGAVNEGHSGGAVMHAGKVVGWVTEGIVNTNSISYAHSITLLLAIPTSLPARGEPTTVVRGHNLGADLVRSTEALFALLGASGQTGVIVRWLGERSPLRDAGMAEGDVLCGMGVGIASQDDAVIPLRVLVDNDGACRVPWANGDRYPIDDLLACAPLGSDVEVLFWSASERGMTTGIARLNDARMNGLRDAYPPYDDVPYEVFAGMVVMDLTARVAHAFPDIGKRLTREQLERPALAVTNIFPGSVLLPDGEDERPPTMRGDILTHVNGREVVDVADFRHAIQEPVDGRFLVLQSRGRWAQVLDMEDVAGAEDVLRKTFDYSPSAAASSALDPFSGP